MSLRHLLVISGIFRKNIDDLDILPPPPPSPVGLEKIKAPKEGKKTGKVIPKQLSKTNKTGRETENTKIIKVSEQNKIDERERKNENVRLKKIKEEEEKQRIEQEKNKKELEIRKQRELEERKEIRKQKVFDFFHKLGLVKTEEEKIELKRQRDEYKKQKELDKKIRELREKRKIEKRRTQIEDEKKKRDFEKKRIEQKRVTEEIEKRRLETVRREQERKQKFEKEGQKVIEIKRKVQETPRIEKLKEDNRIKIFDFLHKPGLVKTEQEKKDSKKLVQKEIELKKLESKLISEKKFIEKTQKELDIRQGAIKQRELKLTKDQTKLSKSEEVGKTEKIELEKEKKVINQRWQELRGQEANQKQRERELSKREDKLTVEKEKHKEVIELERNKESELLSKRKEKLMYDTLKKPENNTVFKKIFGKKKETSFDLELREIEKTGSKLKSSITKSEIPDLISLEKKELTNPMEVVKAEEEIERAISGMKKGKQKKPSILSGFFKRKIEPVEEKLEIPEVMPRTYDKIDYVELIEEKMHKVRMALMDFKFNEAKNVYIQIIKMYDNLESKNKSKVYQDISNLYYERKSAEKFAK